MAAGYLLKYWMGMSKEEITAEWNPELRAAVDDDIADAREKVGRVAFERIVERAESGEVAAVEWLEKRDFIRMPSAPREIAF